MSERKLEEIKEKLLQNSLLRVLVFERWFRVAFAGFVLLIIFLALFLPKIWTTSPSGVLPVIKVSGLDLVQAWSLKRTALRAMAAGKHAEANYAWQAAVGNNRADPDLLRGLLRNHLQSLRGAGSVMQALAGASWLLNLTSTNVADLDLAVQVFERHHYYDALIGLLETRTGQLSASSEASLLKALFAQKRMEAFDARWAMADAMLREEPGLRLYRAAYLAGWGPPGQITEAREELEAAVEKPAARHLACRLLLAVSEHQLDPGAYAQALETLREMREDTLFAHAGYWRLLLVTGRKAEAAALAQAHSSPPATASEVVELARVYSELGLRDLALQLLKRYASDFGDAPLFWITYASELIEARQWEEIRALAVQMRARDGVRDQLAGFSYYLEGRAELALGRDANARAAFEKIRGREFFYPQMGQQIATLLLEAGHAALARDVLAGLEPALSGSVHYWLLMFQAADRLKEIDRMIEAGRRAHELAPNHPGAANNYAAALLIKRYKPEEAIRLTLQLYTQNPNSLFAVVNHSAALLMNQRPQEAEALLRRVQTNGMTKAQIAIYNLDLFEIHMNLRRFDLAWEISDLIDSSLLYPTQQEWLEQSRQQLPPRAQPVAAF
jgi:tetratricopeptide (TPR) repeat protein